MLKTNKHPKQSRQFITDETYFQLTNPILFGSPPHNPAPYLIHLRTKKKKTPRHSSIQQQKPIASVARYSAPNNYEPHCSGRIGPARARARQKASARKPRALSYTLINKNLALWESLRPVITRAQSFL